jgi:hypothetical protein
MTRIHEDARFSASASSAVWAVALASGGGTLLDCMFHSLHVKQEQCAPPHAVPWDPSYKWTGRRELRALPRSLCISLDRILHPLFDMLPTLGTGSDREFKCQKCITFSDSLDLLSPPPLAGAHAGASLVTPALREAVLRQRSERGLPSLGRYALAAVVAHRGDARAGHYVAFRRHAAPCGAVSWYCFDDACVTLSSAEKVLQLCGGQFTDAALLATHFLYTAECCADAPAAADIDDCELLLTAARTFHV